MNLFFKIYSSQEAFKDFTELTRFMGMVEVLETLIDSLQEVNCGLPYRDYLVDQILDRIEKEIEKLRNQLTHNLSKIEAKLNLNNEDGAK